MRLIIIIFAVIGAVVGLVGGLIGGIGFPYLLIYLLLGLYYGLMFSSISAVWRKTGEVFGGVEDIVPRLICFVFGLFFVGPFVSIWKLFTE